MARRVSKKGMIRLIKPDLKYKNFLVSKFINLLMNGGKKSISERIVYEAFDLIRLSFKLNPLWVFLQVIESSRPIAEVKKKRLVEVFIMFLLV